MFYMTAAGLVVAEHTREVVLPILGCLASTRRLPEGIPYPRLIVDVEGHPGVAALFRSSNSCLRFSSEWQVPLLEPEENLRLQVEAHGKNLTFGIVFRLGVAQHADAARQAVRARVLSLVATVDGRARSILVPVSRDRIEMTRLFIGTVEGDFGWVMPTDPRRCFAVYGKIAGPLNWATSLVKDCPVTFFRLTAETEYRLATTARNESSAGSSINAVLEELFTPEEILAFGAWIAGHPEEGIHSVETVRKDVVWFPCGNGPVARKDWPKFIGYPGAFAAWCLEAVDGHDLSVGCLVDLSNGIEVEPEP